MSGTPDHSSGLPIGLRAVRLFIRLALALTPKRRMVLIRSFPDFDDTTRAVAQEAFAQRVPIVVLTSGSPGPKWLPPTGIELVEASSIKGFWRYIRASHVFYTHGLYLSPLPPRRTTVVNVWHGMPIKKICAQIGERFIPAFTFTVATSAYFSALLAEAFEVPLGSVLETGLPRNDILVESMRSRLRSEAEPTIALLPTYRASARGAIRVDGEAGADVAPERIIAELAELLERKGWRAFVKPHPMAPKEEYARWLAPRIDVVTDSDLQASGETLYERLGHCHILITDYSSIAVDAALVGIPVAFVQSDALAYEANRGLNMSPEQLASLGQVFGSWDELLAHLRNLPAGLPTTPKITEDSTRRLFEKIGLATK